MISLALAGLALVAWLLWFGFGNVTVYEVSRQARLEVGSAPREISSLLAGRLTRTHIVIGQKVRAGDVLIELDSKRQQLRLAEAEARLPLYPAKIASLRKEIAYLGRVMENERRSTQAAVRAAQARLQGANAASRFANDSAARIRSDAATGGSAAVDAVRAAADARKAESERDISAAELSRLGVDATVTADQTRVQMERLTRDLLATQAEADSTRQLIQQLRLEVANHQIRAPVSGVVGEMRALSSGAYVAPGQKLATVIPQGDLLIVADFDPTTALGRIRPGQTARFRLEGFPWVQFGTIEATAVRVAGEIRDQSLRAEFRIRRDATRGLVLRHGLPGRIEVRVETVSPARLLLRSAGGLAESPAQKPRGAR
ncbi:MAG TPA: HlyD family efflux transporter periplasmic adaptor subunit [Allosphingosinicella sp.]|nr:HlyD family efflux transporter periplasmic adaptor subunit [Allosphingosinicella sp.]